MYEIHCHHKTPRANGGSDKYDNLVLVSDQIHRLVHATQMETISRYVTLLELNKNQLKKLNEFRGLVGNANI